MPQLDYMVLADYVRQDGNAVHIMGAGIDTVFARVVPAVHAFGVAARISFDTTEEPGEHHQLRLTFSGPDSPLLQADAAFVTPSRLADVPLHWRTGLGIAMQISVPLPQYGDYSCELSIDDGAITKSFDLRVVPLPEG